MDNKSAKEIIKTLHSNYLIETGGVPFENNYTKWLEEKLSAQSAPLATEGLPVKSNIDLKAIEKEVDEALTIENVTEYLKTHPLPSQLEGNTLKQEGEQWVWREVPISPDTMPKEKGWYNISSNAHPKPCGRAFFDGENFKFTNSSATKGILEQGGKLFWLERHPSQPLLGCTLQQVASDSYDAGFKRGFDQVNVLTPDGQIYPDKATYLSTLTAPIPAERDGKDAVRFGKFLREHGFQTMNGIMQNMTTTELYQRYKQYLSTLK